MIEMKKVFLGLLAALMLTVPAFAHPLITVYVDGKQLSFDQPPIIQDDRTLVPMRKIFEALDAQVIWDEADQTVMAMHNEDIIMLQIGEAGLYKNGELVYTMSVPAQIINDRTLVPLRAVAESLGASVAWDGVKYVIDIHSDGTSEKPADLMRSEIGYYLETFLEFIGYSFEMMCLHDRKHYFLVDGKRHVDFRTFDHSGPMLVADGMSEFDRATDHCVSILVLERAHVNDEHRTQFDTKNHGFSGVRIICDHIAVDDLCMTFQSHGIFFTFKAFAEETALLSRPLVKNNIIDITALYLGGPLGIAVYIA